MEKDLIKIYLADIQKVEQVDRFVDFVNDNFNQIDILVNAAGIIANGTIENTALEDWDNMLNINLRVVFYMMQQMCSAFGEKQGKYC